MSKGTIGLREFKFVGMFIMLFAALILFTGSASAAGFVNGIGVVPIKHSVTGKIESQVAVIKVEQIFTNTSAHKHNCTYSFPLPLDAGVTSFAYWVDGQKILGSVKAKASAAREYHSASMNGQTAALGSISKNSNSVTDKAYENLFTMNISNLEPNETRRVELVYSQVLPYSEGRVSFTYPLLNKHRNSSIHAHDISLDIEIVTSRNVKKVWSGINSIDVVQKSEKNFRLYYEGAFDFGVPELNIYYELFSKEMGFSCLSDKNHFMMTLAPQEDVAESQKLSKHVTFVIDTSGSMRGRKLESTKQAFAKFLNDLDKRDFFSIYTFSSYYKNYYEKPLNATPENRAKAVKYIDNLMARGGTNIYDTLHTVLSRRMIADVELVVFMTDGDPSAGTTCNMDVINSMVEKRINEKRMSVFGLGNNVRTEFLKSMADKGRGLFASVKDGADLKVELERFSSAIAVPLLSDIKVEITGKDINAFDIYPKDMPVLYKGAQMVIAGSKKGSGDIQVKFSAVHKNGKVKEFIYSANFEDHDKYGFIGGVWARKKVKSLLKEYDSFSSGRTGIYISKTKQLEKIKKEVIQVATKYNIATAFTSFSATGPIKPAMPVASKFKRNGFKTTKRTASRPVRTINSSNSSKLSNSLKSSTRGYTPDYKPSRRKITTSPIPFFPLFIPNFSKARRQSRVKSCVANMRTIEGAIEMYQMDHTGQLPDDLFQRLVSEKYLKKMPVCKSGGQYMIKEDKGIIEVVCSKHGTILSPHSSDYSHSKYVNEGPIKRVMLDGAYLFINFANQWIGIVSTLLLVLAPILYFFNINITLGIFFYYTLLPYIIPVQMTFSLIKWIFNRIVKTDSKKRIFKSSPMYSDMPA